MAVGWRLDALKPKNTVLTVGPFDPEGTERAIIIAAQILLGNIKEERIRGDEVLLMTTMPYVDDKPGERNLAAKSAKYLARRALKVIETHTPELMNYLYTLVLRTNMNTRYAEVIDFEI